MLGYSELFMDRIMIDGLYNPWFDMISVYAICLFMAGWFFYWINRRINDAEVYNVLAYGLAFCGGFMLLFGRNPFPNALVVLFFVLSVFASLACFVTILTVLAVQRLPAAGIPESFVHDPDDHTVRVHMPFLVTFLLLFLVWLIFTSPFLILGAVLGDILSMVFIFIGVLLVSLWAYDLLPMNPVRETALLGETAPPKELDDIFVLSGAAHAMERITVPIITLAFTGVFVYFAQHGLQIGGEDWFGAVFLFFLGASIVYTEYARAQRAAKFASAPRRTMRNI